MAWAVQFGRPILIALMKLLKKSKAERSGSTSTPTFNPHIPFGGIKTSGIGAELGEEGLAEFTARKVINVAKA